MFTFDLPLNENARNPLVLNPFLVNVSILYPLKTPETQRFSGVFMGYKIETLVRNGLNTKNFLVFSKGIKRKHWEEMG